MKGKDIGRLKNAWKCT